MAFNGQLLDGLVIFAEVVSAGSFTRAAEASGHSTSYISKEVSKLEERLGVRLLNRTTRSLSLTPEGELYFRSCEQLINDAEQAENALVGNTAEPRGLLRISCPLSFGLSRLRPMLPAFTERYPDVKIELDLNDRFVDIVAEGYDIAIRAAAQLEDSSLVSRTLMRSKGVTVASPAYLEKHGTPASPEDLTGHQTITYSHLRQPNAWTYVNSDGKELTVKLDSRVVTNSPEMELALAIAGQGITRLPLFNLNDELETGTLVELFPQMSPWPIDVYMVYPSRKHIAPRVRAFMDFVIAELGDDQ